MNTEYTVTLDLNILYRRPNSEIDKEDAQEELTDLLAEHQETIANLIADLIGLSVEVDQIETARCSRSRVLA